MWRETRDEWVVMKSKKPKNPWRRTYLSSKISNFVLHLSYFVGLVHGVGWKIHLLLLKDLITLKFFFTYPSHLRPSFLGSANNKEKRNVPKKQTSFLNGDFPTLYSREDIFWVSSATHWVFSASRIRAIIRSSFMRDSKSAYFRWASRTCLSNLASMLVLLSKHSLNRLVSSACLFNWLAMTWFWR